MTGPDLFSPRLAAADRLEKPRDPVGALRRLTARYTLHGTDFAVPDGAAWREALAEYHALMAERARLGTALPFPNGVVLAQLHNLEIFCDGVARSGGPILPLYLFAQAGRIARRLPTIGLHRAA
jgi:hypothetical protein